MEIAIIFPTIDRSKWFFEDKLMPLISDLEKVGNGIYKNRNNTVRILSSYNPDLLRGLSLDYVYFSDECSSKVYDIMLQSVRGDHNKIQVVI